MWSEWKPNIVEKDLKILKENGVSCLRIFPLWSDFQPITELLGHAGSVRQISHGEEFLEDTEEGRAGIDVVMIERFSAFIKLAEKYGFTLIVSLLTGWMSGRCFFPPALYGKNVITDPFCIKWEVRFVKYIVRKFKNAENIIAWELGNECNCMAKTDTQDQAWLWANIIVDAIKSEDSNRKVLSGMHGLMCGRSFTITSMSEICDVLTTHPYALFTKHCDYEGLLSSRAIQHASAENCMYADIGGKGSLIEEIGSFGGTMLSDQENAKFVRASLFNAWAYDGLGYFWWCAFDQLHLSYAPYEWEDLERELGLIDFDYNEKPAIKEYKKFSEFLSKLPFNKLPSRERNALCLINESSWENAFGCQLIAKRAGLDIEYSLKKKELKDYSLYIVPGEKELTTLPKSVLDELYKRVEDGAVLLLTCDKNIISPFEKIIGCVSEGRRVAPPLNTIYNGKKIVVKREYAIKLKPTTATILHETEDGEVVFTSNQFGKGKILFFNAPIESSFATTPYGHNENAVEEVYKTAMRLAGINRIVECSSPDIDFTIHYLDKDNAVIVAMNNTENDICCDIKINGGVLSEVYYGRFDEDVKIPAGDALVFNVKVNR
ncbi:MAG: cellulase family glycosylhydrolase [Clostridia bacterium]|nr:cellulase family glycosylhydrolase [Clostridia bacterium]